MNGVLNVCKEKGYTSHDVVAHLRGICHQKKIGHTGTLDPDATGVLPVCFGNATKLCDFLTDCFKTYEAKMLLGMETDTYDTSGVMLTNKGAAGVKEEAVREAVLSFLPGYDQIPPMWSAKKVGGKKLYELARAGIEVERKSVPVKITELTILAMDLPHVDFAVTCSKGTYIRSLIHDIGEKLGCGAVMEELKRTSASGFAIADALKLDEISDLMEEEKLEERLIPTDKVLSAYPALHAKEEADRLLRNGNPVETSFVTESLKPEQAGLFRIYDSTGRFIGLYRLTNGGKRLKPDKMFL
ncbi:MAG: tRNA pseudouridine(55) synthase TruB [Lachnospiraceae bacterium]|nr:tRNA pseudouridine(55) synthase TruB [Lachnospiraceae bacterium]